MAGIPDGASAAAKRRYVLGAGRVYFAPLGSTGTLGGERYLGSSPGFTLDVTAEKTEVFDDDGPIADRVVDITRQVAHAFSVQCKDMTPENLALFVGGAVASQADVATAMDGAQNAANARDKIVVDAKDRFYKLGIWPVTTTAPARTAKPAGVRAISPTPADTVVSEAADGSTTKTAGTDYVVDDKHGRIYIPSGSSIAVGDTVYVEYKPIAAAAIPRVDFAEPKQIRGAIRYIEDSANKNVPAGNYGNEFYAPLCTVTPGGQLQIKSREQPQIVTLSVAVQDPSSGPSFSILQQAA